MRRPMFIARQSGRPSGFLGWLIGWIMSHETEAENSRTLELLELHPTDRVLEVGFGHGRTIARALSLVPSGCVAGVDVSSRMVEMATARNEAAVRAGRVELRRTDGTQLPYADATFDKAYSVHTIYFWTDAVAQLREICRVLKPQGRLVLTFKYGERNVADLPAPVYTHRPLAEVSALLTASGFATLNVCEEAPLYFIVAKRAPT